MQRATELSGNAFARHLVLRALLARRSLQAPVSCRQTRGLGTPFVPSSAFRAPLPVGGQCAGDSVHARAPHICQHLHARRSQNAAQIAFDTVSCHTPERTRTPRPLFAASGSKKSSRNGVIYSQQHQLINMDDLLWC